MGKTSRGVADGGAQITGAASEDPLVRRGASGRGMVRDDHLRRLKERLLAQGKAAPARGTYIEVRGQSFSVVGQVRWARGEHCGVRTRESFDPLALAAGRVAEQPPQQARAPSVQVKRVDPAQLAEQSRANARRLNAAMVALVAIGAALTLGAAVLSFLKAPFDRIGSEMQSRNPITGP